MWYTISMSINDPGSREISPELPPHKANLTCNVSGEGQFFFKHGADYFSSDRLVDHFIVFNGGVYVIDMRNKQLVPADGRPFTPTSKTHPQAHIPLDSLKGKKVQFRLCDDPGRAESYRQDVNP